MKKLLSFILALALIIPLSACSKKQDKKDVLKVAVLESAYGSEMWREVCKAFTDATGIEVSLTAEKNLEDVISPRMKGGDYPDVVHLATGREAGLTETMIRENLLSDLSGVLEMRIPGEDGTVKEKLSDGFVSTLATNPYADGKTYLAPMFYSPCGLFYNETLLKQNNWEVPESWDEMWSLGEAAKAKGIYLFTYPTAGYFDAFIYALLASSGGVDFYNNAMRYKDGIWESESARDVFNIIAKLKEYTEPTTVANANNENYLKNQQLVLSGKVLFMPNGTWVTDEMKDAPRTENFKWGFTELPAVSEGGDRYAFTFIEQCWIPKEAPHKDDAEKFVAFLYSDKAAGIFRRHGAVQPIDDIDEGMTGDMQLFYSIYDEGAKAVMGGFATTDPAPGVSIYSSLFDAINSVMSGDKSLDEWISDVEKTSDALREKLK